MTEFRSDSSNTGNNRLFDGTECPEMEMLSAYAEGRLGDTQRHEIERHVAACEDCYWLLKETLMTLPAVEESPRGRSRWTYLPVAAAILIGLASTAGWFHFRHKNPVDQLVREIGSRRFFEARVSGGFGYGPLIGPSRGTGTGTEQLWSLMALGSAIREDAQSDPTTDNLRALALVHLFLGHPNEAVELLEDLVKQNPGNPVLKSDLSAAYLTRAELEDRAEDWPKALQATEEALELAPDLREAQFNRGLALEALQLTEQAAETWESYLSHYPTDEWKPSVVEHLERLRRRAPLPKGSDVSPQDERLEVEETLLGRWANETVSSNPLRAQEALSRARVAALDYLARTGDHLLADAIESIRVARRLDDLSSGHVLYVEGLRASRAEEWIKAQDAFALAELRLRSGGSPFYRWATVQKAICEYYRGRHQSALLTLDEALRDAPMEYRAIRARGLWIRGLIQYVLGRPYEALLAHRKSLALFERLQEVEHAAMVRSLLANDLAALGRSNEAWRYWIQSLAFGQHPLSPRRAYLLYWGVARACEASMPYVSSSVAREMLPKVRAQAGPFDNGILASALIDLVRVTENHPQRDDGLSLIAEAETQLALASPEMRKTLLPDLELVRGRVLSKRNPAEALDSLSYALELYEDVGETFELTEVLSLRASVLEKLGRPIDAVRDEEAGIQNIRRIALGMPPGSPRLKVANQAERFTGRLVSGLIRMGHSDRALLMLEETRALLHGGQKEASRINSLSLSQLAALLPEQTLVVELIIVGDDLAVWLLTHDSQRFHLTPMAASEVRHLVHSSRISGMPVGESVTSVEPTAQKYSHIVFVPDGFLYDLSLKQLSAIAGVQMGSAQTTSVAPSLYHLVRGSAEPPPEPRHVLLSLGETGQALATLGLRPLSAADDEIDAIASVYRDAEVAPVVTTNAGAFLTAIRHADVVHFAGHAIEGDVAPELEAMVLHGDDLSPVLVYAQDVESLTLRRGATIILAGCRTSANGSTVRNVAPGLVQAFLDAGASTVIAVQSDLDDRASAALMPRIHRELAIGVSPELAVRNVLVETGAENLATAEAVVTYIADRAKSEETRSPVPTTIEETSQ